MTKPRAKNVNKPSASKKGDADRTPNIEWMKNPDWTWSIVAYLTTHPTFRIKLFSDSTADAKKEGCNKAVAKDGKPQQYAVLAQHVFDNEPSQKKMYSANPTRFATSVETRFRRLKKEYRLDPNDVEDDTPMANLVASIVAKWPWWKEFHGFWRELPNYNPIGVTSSTPGADHAAAAAALFDVPTEVEPDDPPEGDAPGKDADNNEGSEADLDMAEKSGEDDDESSDKSSAKKQKSGGTTVKGTKAKPVASGHISEDDDDEESEVEVVPKKRNSKGGSVITSTKAKTVGSGRDAGLAKAHANAASKKAEKHKSAAEKFTDFRQTEADRVERKRERDHELKMAEARNKRLKYEYKNRAAEQEHEARVEEIRLQGAARAEELRLQIELARLTAPSAAGSAAAQPAAAQGPVGPPVQVSAPAPQQDFATPSTASKSRQRAAANFATPPATNTSRPFLTPPATPFLTPPATAPLANPRIPFSSFNAQMQTHKTYDDKSHQAGHGEDQADREQNDGNFYFNDENNFDFMNMIDYGGNN
ncbi:hypothetical protein B0H34DRAFT_808159 [Crassisporium funariophilum]|nr:hypothetical protein B0H34DRAFT_808159 [Crassisporium funariophilum]